MKIVLECLSVEARGDGRYLFKMLPLQPAGEQQTPLEITGTVDGTAPVPGRFYDLMLRGMFVSDETSGSYVCDVSTFETKQVLKGITNQEWCDALERSQRR